MHVPVRQAYTTIKHEGLDTGEEVAHQMAVKSVNDSAGSDSFVPALLGYGALPQLELSSDLPIPCNFKRAAALRKAT